MNQPDTIQLDLPASLKYLNVLGACLAEMLTRVEKLPERDTLIYSIQLAAQELCTNIVEHAYANQQPERIKITMSLSFAPRSLTIETLDDGQVTFDLKQTRSNMDVDEDRIRGRGLVLIHELMDEVSYYPQSGNSRWHLVKNL